VFQPLLPNMLNFEPLFARDMSFPMFRVFDDPIAYISTCVSTPHFDSSSLYTILTISSKLDPPSPVSRLNSTLVHPRTPTWIAQFQIARLRKGRSLSGPVAGINSSCSWLWLSWRSTPGGVQAGTPYYCNQQISLYNNIKAFVATGLYHVLHGPVTAL